MKPFRPITTMLLTFLRLWAKKAILAHCATTKLFSTLNPYLLNQNQYGNYPYPGYPGSTAGGAGLPTTTSNLMPPNMIMPPASLPQGANLQNSSLQPQSSLQPSGMQNSTNFSQSLSGLLNPSLSNANLSNPNMQHMQHLPNNLPQLGLVSPPDLGSTGHSATPPHSNSNLQWMPGQNLMNSGAIPTPTESFTSQATATENENKVNMSLDSTHPEF